MVRCEKYFIASGMPPALSQGEGWRASGPPHGNKYMPIIILRVPKLWLEMCHRQQPRSGPAATAHGQRLPFIAQRPKRNTSRTTNRSSNKNKNKNNNNNNNNDNDNDNNNHNNNNNNHRCSNNGSSGPFYSPAPATRTTNRSSNKNKNKNNDNNNNNNDKNNDTDNQCSVQQQWQQQQQPQQQQEGNSAQPTANKNNTPREDPGGIEPEIFWVRGCCGGRGACACGLWLVGWGGRGGRGCF